MTPSVNGRFRRVGDGRVVYQTAWMAVREYVVERDGAAGTYPVVERPDSIVVIPLTPTRRTVLLRQFRFPMNADSWELPMGSAEDGEAAATAAARELVEEVGLLAHDFVNIGEYRAAPGLSPQKVTVFVSRVSDDALEGAGVSWASSDEIQEMRIVTVSALDDMVRNGQVVDGFSLASLLLLRLAIDHQLFDQSGESANR